MLTTDGSLPQQLGVVWSRLLEADSEGPSFISHAACARSVSSSRTFLSCACGALPMAQLALEGRAVAPAQVVDRAPVLNRLRTGDAVFRALTLASALIILGLLGGVGIALVEGAAPALRAFGFDFFTTQSWNPVTERFGALAPIYGTIVTSIIAMLIAVPVGLGIAIFLTELCPPWARRPVGIAIELLAGIPSIIYGIWGLFVFAPFL